MFAFRAVSWGRSYLVETGLRRTTSLTNHANGIITGTQVATQMGWRNVEDLIAGDQVMTLDAGMQTVAAIETITVSTGGAAASCEDWPVLIPADALSNIDPMILLPRQSVTIEAQAAKALFGDPFAMVPAQALDGLRGIRRIPPPDTLELVTLVFAQDQVVCANMGGYLACPRSRDLHDAGDSACQTLTDPQSALLVDAMKIDDAAPGGGMAAA